MQKQLLLVGLFLFFAVPATALRWRTPIVPAVIVFGDSIADAGNNNNLKTIIKCNFPPYGREFDDHLPTGRFSNGKIINDILASFAGISNSLMAYLDPDLRDSDLFHGVTFASGGAGLDDLTSQVTSTISLPSQLELFKQYMVRLSSVAGEEQANYIISNAQYLLIMGSNDIWNTYFALGLRKQQYDIDSYTDLLLAAATKFIEEIYKLGARRIAVAGLPALGCIPFVRTVAGGIGRQCSAPHNEACELYNKKLSRKIQRLNDQILDAVVIYLDVYNPLMDMIENPQQYGFEEAQRGCCGTGEMEVLFLCNSLSPNTCADDSKYVFWDSFHPTEAAYRHLVNTTLRSFF